MGSGTSETSSRNGGGSAGWLWGALQAVRAKPSLTILIMLTVMGTALRIRYFSGILGTDDLSHAYGGHFFVEHLRKGHVPQENHISSLRVGLDFLLWVPQSIFGVHEWSLGLVPFASSLLGIWAIYLLGRRMAGETAGIASAAFLTFLPVDVYLAGVWLHETVQSLLFIAATIWFIRSMEAEPRRGAVGWGLLSGVAVGYAAVVKEIAPMVLAAFVIWSLLRVRRDRRVSRVLWVVAGFILVMAVVAVYWQLRTGDPLFNIRLLAARHAVVNRMPTTAERILRAFPEMIIRQLPFGPVLLLTPIFILIFAFARSIRYRWLILTWFAVMCLCLMKVAQLGVQQRYLMLIVPSMIIIAAGALAVIVRPLPTRLGYGVVAIVTGLTLLGFGYCPQQFGRVRMTPLRSVHTILSLADTASTPVFADQRTMLVLYQLNGFQPYPGGLYRYPTHGPPGDTQTPLADPFVNAFYGQYGVAMADDRYGVAPDDTELTRRRDGWVVFHERFADIFDKGKWGVPMPQVLWHPPSNWTVVARFGEGRRGTVVALYRIVPQHTFEQLSLTRMAYGRSDYARGVAADEVDTSEHGLRYEAALNPPRSGIDRRFAGVNLPIKSDGFRLQMSFEHLDQIVAVYVYAREGEGVPLTWRAAGRDLPRPAGEGTYAFVPSELSDPFVLTRMIPGREVNSVDVFVEATPRADSLGFTISRVQTRRY